MMSRYYLNLWAALVVLMIGYLLGTANYLAAGVMTGLLIIAMTVPRVLESRAQGARARSR